MVTEYVQYSLFLPRKPLDKNVERVLHISYKYLLKSNVFFKNGVNQTLFLCLKCVRGNY